MLDTSGSRTAADADRAAVGVTALLAAVGVLALGVGGWLVAGPGSAGAALGPGSDVPASLENATTTVDAGDESVRVVTQHAPVVDRDGDGLADVDERRRYGTNPRVADTDGDGLPDGLEVACDGRLPGADPLSQDVYVELDSTRAAHVSNASVEQLEAAFARAPVENPDGTAGIDLHVVRSDGDLPAADEPVNSHARPGTANDLTDYRERYADHDGHGYYYLLAAEEVAYRGDDYYVGAGRQGVALIQPFTRSQITASLLMHELGHAFGLDRAQHGVDDERYGLAEYRSVMSYNGLYEVMTYSTGDGEVGRDEWAYVATERYQPAADCDGPSCLPAC